MKSKLETEKTKFTRKAVIQRETQAELEVCVYSIVWVCVLS